MSLGKLPWRKPRGSRAELAAITAEVAARHGLTVDQLTGRARSPLLFEARAEALARAYATDRFSTLTLGAYFGGRHHATILHAIARSPRS